MKNKAVYILLGMLIVVCLLFSVGNVSAGKDPCDGPAGNRNPNCNNTEKDTSNDTKGTSKQDETDGPGNTVLVCQKHDHGKFNDHPVSANNVEKFLENHPGSYLGKCIVEEEEDDDSSTSKQVVKTIETEEVETAQAICEQCVTVEVPIRRESDVAEALQILEGLEAEGYYCPSCVEVIIITNTPKDLEWAIPALQTLEEAGYYCEISAQ